MDLRQILVLANAFKEGDLLLGGTADDQVRTDARSVLGGLTVGEIDRVRLVDDGVSEALAQARDRQLASEVVALRIGDLKSRLLSEAGAEWIARYRAGLSSETIAAVVKLMTAEELSRIACRVFNPLPGAGVAVGSARHFGSRIQPNSPGDDETEILFSILEGLTYGCGDVILGLNPASDDVDTIARLSELLVRVRERLDLPTRTCVLSDIIKQTSARARARVDVGFQSLAGTSRALGGMVGLDVDGILELARGFDGLYFETGQGSEVTNGAAEGIDMVTLEARTYGVARLIQQQAGKWTIVNDVAGFIGPEVFRSGKQLHRACLEDAVMAKLHGLTMGLDVCATFHMGIPPAELRELTARITAQAAPAYLMAVAGNADPMLGYLTTSFREHPRLRALTGRGPTSAMSAWGARRMAPKSLAIPRLYARYHRAGGDRRSESELEREARVTLSRLQEPGWDLGHDDGVEGKPPAAQEKRLERIYQHARRALYASIDRAVLRDVTSELLPVRSEARSRDDYLMHPAAGERIRPEDAAAIRSMYPVARPTAQIVISDGLNADAVSENLRTVLPLLRSRLNEGGVAAGGREIVIENGRVRAGYHAGQLLGVDVIIHLIGERPGTGLNTLSAYVTYGRDERGELRWSIDLDHACTTAICGIHPMGKKPEAAAEEIARSVQRMLEERRSGVLLGKSEGRTPN